jgi:hypothetical protein
MTLGYATQVRVKWVTLTPGNWESQMAVERALALLRINCNLKINYLHT